MCYGTEAIYISAALAAAGAATSSYASSQQLKSQDKIAAEGILKQGQLQKQGEAEASTQIGQLAKSNAATQKTSSDQLAAYQKALQQGSGITSSDNPNVPGASKAYKSATTQATGGASDYVNKIANSAATTQGTQLERVDENTQMGATAGNLGILNNEANEQNYLTKLKVQSTQANPWLKGLGTLLSVAGAAYGGAAGFASAGTSAAGDAAAAAGTTAAQGAQDSAFTAAGYSTAASNAALEGNGGYISAMGANPFG